jgi:predicted nuclease with TOPRIM domain
MFCFRPPSVREDIQDIKREIHRLSDVLKEVHHENIRLRENHSKMYVLYEKAQTENTELRTSMDVLRNDHQNILTSYDRLREHFALVVTGSGSNSSE